MKTSMDRLSSMLHISSCFPMNRFSTDFIVTSCDSERCCCFKRVCFLLCLCVCVNKLKVVLEACLAVWTTIQDLVVASILAGVGTFFSAEPTKSRQAYDIIATVGDAEMKLGSCRPKCRSSTEMCVVYKYHYSRFNNIFICIQCTYRPSYLRRRRRYIFLPVFVCLSVSKITQKHVHGFG